MQSILIMFHCESNTGYAIGRLEPTFFKAAAALTDNDMSRIHVSYTSLQSGKPKTLPEEFNQILAFDPTDASHDNCTRIAEYIRQNRIDTIFGFDQPVSRRPIYKYFRSAGVKHFISYWGAPISSIFGSFKLMLKRLDVLLHRHAPDHYIFESKGMADTAIFGRGISPSRVHVAYLGVDITKFKPNIADREYIYRSFDIAANKKIFFYSGHMEPRKGVAVIMQAVNHLSEHREQDDWHVVITGNKPGEENYLKAMLKNDSARNHVTFGGYRNDIETLHRGCYAGIIASTGWDSLTCSSLEMQSSGLPLLLSDLLGLREACEHDQSGLLFEPGDYRQLAQHMQRLLDDENYRNTLSNGARERVEKSFSEQAQLNRLVEIMRTVTAK